jgi:hypothetical protein
MPAELKTVLESFDCTFRSPAFPVPTLVNFVSYSFGTFGYKNN